MTKGIRNEVFAKRLKIIKRGSLRREREGERERWREGEGGRERERKSIFVVNRP